MAKNRIRVLHQTPSLGIGGTEKVMQLFVESLDRDSFDVAVFSPVDGPRGVQLRKAGIPTYVGLDFLAVLERLRPDIVHIHRAGWTEPGSLRPLRLAKIPVVVETNVFGRQDPSPEAAVITRTLFVSRFCLERFHRTNSIPPAPGRYDFLYNPVDTDAFQKLSRMDRDFSIPIAARISRSDPGKWSPLALHFIPRVVQDIPDFRYHVIGATTEAREYIRQHHLENTVHLHPPIESDSEIATFLDKASVLAHANDTGESFGLAIAEAMACGLPVITHPAAGERDNAQLELVDDGITGLIVRNADEYAAAMLWLFSNPDKAEAMGRAGREKAQRLFRRQTITRRLEGIYRELLPNRRTA